MIHRLIVSLEGTPEDTPDAIAQAWDEEIARRVAEIDSGKAVLIPHEQVAAEIDELLKQPRAITNTRFSITSCHLF